MGIIVRASRQEDGHLSLQAAQLIHQASKESDIATRSPQLIQEKIQYGHAVLAFGGTSGEAPLIGFGYLAAWADKVLSHSGLVIDPNYRGSGLFRQMKAVLIEIGRELFPGSDVISLTSSPAVRKVNLELGYREVNLVELTTDPAFWDGCKGCRHYEVLNTQDQQKCSSEPNVHHRPPLTIHNPDVNILGEKCCCRGMRLLVLR